MPQIPIKQIENLEDLVDPSAQEISSTPTSLTATRVRIYVDATSSDIELDLPAISGNDGLRYEIFQVAGTNNILLDPNSTEKIQGSTSTLTVGGTMGDSVVLVCRGTGSYAGWWLI